MPVKHCLFTKETKNKKNISRRKRYVEIRLRFYIYSNFECWKNDEVKICWEINRDFSGVQLNRKIGLLEYAYNGSKAKETQVCRLWP